MTGNVARRNADPAELDPGLEYRFMNEDRRAYRWLKLLQEETDRVVIGQLKEIMPPEVRSAIADLYKRAGR